MSGANRVVRYRVEVDAAQAQAQARQLAQMFAREMSTAQRTAASAGGGLPSPSAVASSGGALGGIGGALAGGAAAYLTVQGLRTLSTFTMDLAALNEQATRSRAAFAALSGGAGEAEKRLKAIQRASNGTMDELTAMNLANRLVALGMADSSGEMEKAVETGRKIATVMGGDVQGALENLSLAAANLSFMRLDQMGISATKVRARMKELTEANQALGKEQAFLQAAMEIANTTFAGIDTSTAVSNTERLTAALKDLRLVVAEGWVGGIASGVVAGTADQIRKLQGLLSGQTVETGRESLEIGVTQTKYQIEKGITGTKTTEEQKFFVSVAEEAMAVQDQLNAAIDAGVPGLDRYSKTVGEAIINLSMMGDLTLEQATTIAMLTDGLAVVAEGTSSYAMQMEFLSAEFVAQSPAAQALLARFVELDMAYASGQLSAAQYAGGLQGLRAAFEDVKVAADDFAASAGIDAALRIDLLKKQGYVLDATGNQVLDPKSGQPVLQPWAPGYQAGVNDGTYQLEWEYEVAQERKRNDERAALEWQRAADATASDMEAAAEKMASDFKSSLDQVAGLFSPTSVTEEDMALAEAGVYQEKPDEYLRQLRDEVLNGKDYADVDIADAARRAGISGALDPKAILAQFEAAWGDQSLFAGGKNLDLINQEAVQAALARQKDSASGREAIYALFGLGDPESTQQQMLAQASGLTGGANVDPALLQGMTPDASFDPAASLAALRTGFESDETVTALRDIGIGMAGHLYAGFAFGVGEHDWAATILANLEARIVATAVATMATAMESD